MLCNFRTYNLAVTFYRSCEGIKARTSLKDQLMRACESIVLNLAEGSAKPTEKDRKRFYFIALGSFREVEACLHLLNYVHLADLSNKLGSHRYRLCHPLQRQ